MTPGLFGGIFLILGAFSLWLGRLRLSVFFYFIADLCWVFLAYENNDIFGAVVIIIGMLFGFLVWLKSTFGIFVKDLRVKNN